MYLGFFSIFYNILFNKHEAFLGWGDQNLV